MIIKGKRTTIDHVDVEVNASAFIEQIYVKSIPIGMSYIGSDGHWYVTDGFDYHKREDLYAKSRAATDDELKLRESYLTLRKFIEDHKI